MIDRDLLLEMGFILGNGWNHEVYVYEGWFWVHYSEAGKFEKGGLQDRQINGNSATLKEFFAKFFEAFRNELLDSAYVAF